jgi:hypothetical protein
MTKLLGYIEGPDFISNDAGGEELRSQYATRMYPVYLGKDGLVEIPGSPYLYTELEALEIIASQND